MAWHRGRLPRRGEGRGKAEYVHFDGPGGLGASPGGEVGEGLLPFPVWGEVEAVLQLLLSERVSLAVVEGKPALGPHLCVYHVNSA